MGGFHFPFDHQIDAVGDDMGYDGHIFSERYKERVKKPVKKRLMLFELKILYSLKEFSPPALPFARCLHSQLSQGEPSQGWKYKYILILNVAGSSKNLQNCKCR